ncbi:MAG TPA: DUF222 domain-containing protein [Mycobacterium sp.]|nr:MAG: HNH endonuclease [Mycobacterium sp.]HOB48862.1 DUF222 domain-containing protein [Mycobacterium sp.]HPZ95863.1 DUF222 domain-containing protein [Mycobacterium sp.]HQE14330.1 DUF222 domain-containing protein [Mycobacterium sp.]
MFDNRVHDHWEPPESPESRSLLETLTFARRAENQAAARRLRAAGRLFETRRAERGESEDWAVDSWAAVSAEIAAAASITPGRAGSWIRHGVAMRRLPATAAVFEAGDLDADTFATIAYRTELVTDPDTTERLDRLIAARAARWRARSLGRTIAEIDRLVHQVDRDAVRRRRERIRDREITVWDATEDTADISGRLLATDAVALDKRLDALAATVCEADPRTHAQRRADALGALAAGAQRLMCRCERPDCPAAAAVASSVVIHVVADQSALEGSTDNPAHLYGSDTLISADLLREIAATARLRPLIHPANAPAEPHYRPSRALADFVRARDLTCRAPGCDRPATECDLDHTIPYGRGGPTHASNIKALCRLHHLLKTFWGWRDRQLPDGTVIWELPGRQTYVTNPGSKPLFPTLSAPTSPPLIPPRYCAADPTAMPKRATTRARNRAHHLATERNANRTEREAREARQIREAALVRRPPPGPGDDSPPF